MISFFSKAFLVVFLVVFLAGNFDSQKVEKKPIEKNIPTKAEKISSEVSIKKPNKQEISKTTEKKVDNKSTVATTTTIVKKQISKSIIPTKKNYVETKSKIVASTTNSTTNLVSIAIPVDFGLINEKTRLALVNIICSNTKFGILSPITGSGVVVSNTGVILTNAHIGQYFLLKDFNGEKDYLNCVIRTGSPAYSTYKAKLVYISPDWIENNKTVLIDKNPLGTGEYDYSFLKINGKVDGSELPNTFDFLKLSLNENIAVGSTTLLASYPAGFLGGISIIQSLYQSSAITKVSELFTFNEDTIDLISVGGTIVSQKGSSGGAVVDEYGEMIGMISTSGSGDMTSQRDLRAITPAYINRDLKRKTGAGIFDLINNADSVSFVFIQNIAPILTKTLTDIILGNKI